MAYTRHPPNKKKAEVFFFYSGRENKTAGQCALNSQMEDIKGAERLESVVFEGSGSFHNMSTLIQAAPNIEHKHRINFDIVNPLLEIEAGCVVTREGRVRICAITDPLIAQIIALKPFIVPENEMFFVLWVTSIFEGLLNDNPHERLFLRHLFRGSAAVDLWFAQRDLPAIDIGNPVAGVLQTMRASQGALM